MKVRTLLATLGVTVAIAAPLAAFGDSPWEPSGGEPGSHMVTPDRSAPRRGAVRDEFAAMHPGNVAFHRHHANTDEHADWSQRMLQHCLEVDPPADPHDIPDGHMHAD